MPKCPGGEIAAPKFPRPNSNYYRQKYIILHYHDLLDWDEFSIVLSPEENYLNPFCAIYLFTTFITNIAKACYKAVFTFNEQMDSTGHLVVRILCPFGRLHETNTYIPSINCLTQARIFFDVQTQLETRKKANESIHSLSFNLHWLNFDLFSFSY